MHIRFSLCRVFIGLLLLAASVAAFERVPNLEIGLAIGAVVGTAFFVLALVAKKSDAWIIIRAYVLSAIGALVGALLSPGTVRDPPSFAPVFAGALFGWFVAAVITQSKSVSRRKTANLGSAAENTRPPGSRENTDA